jgi:hypothetical protein
MLGAEGSLSDDEVPIPRLSAPPPPHGLLPVLPLPRLLTVMMKFIFCVPHAVLLCFRVMVMLQFISRAPVLAFPPPPPLLLLALNIPRRLCNNKDILLIVPVSLHLPSPLTSCTSVYYGTVPQ